MDFDKIQVTNLRWAHPEVLTDPGIYDWPTWHASIPVGYIAMRWGAVIAKMAPPAASLK